MEQFCIGWKTARAAVMVLRDEGLVYTIPSAAPSSSAVESGLAPAIPIRSPAIADDGSLA